MLKVVEVRSGLFKDRVCFKCVEKEFTQISTFFGIKYLYVIEKRKIVLKCKKAMYQVGDCVYLYQLVNSNTQLKFSWSHTTPW